MISILAFAVGTVFLFGSMKLRRADFAKRIRRLKICGINCGDIFKYKVLSLLPLSAVSSLIGTAVGSLISLALINILTGIIDYMSVHIPVTALIFITLFDIIFVMAIALLYEHRELSKRPLYTKAETKEKTTIRLSRRIFIRKPLLSWSLKLFAYDSAKQASIFLCIFVTNFFAVYMTSYLYYETKWQEKQTFDYEIQNSSDYVSAGSFGIRMGSSATPEPADTDYIFASDEVKSVYGIAASRIHILDGSLSEENPFKRLAPDTYTTVEMLREEMESYGYPTDAPLFVSRIVFCNKELISTALTNSKTGDFELKKGEAVLCVEGESPYKVGDTVKVTQPSYKTRKRVDAELRIAAVIKPDDLPEKCRYTNAFYTCDGEFPLLPDEGKFNSVYINLKDSNDYDDVESRIDGLISLYGSLIKVESARAYNAGIAARALSLSIITVLIGSVLIIYCLTSISGMVKAKISAELCTWGILRTEGATKKSAAAAYFGETAISVLLACSLSSAAFYCLLLANDTYSNAINPLFSVLIPVIILAIAYICIYKSVCGFWRMSPKEMLNSK